MYIMVINCGSSSLKFQLIALPEKTVLATGIVERIGQPVAAQFTVKTTTGAFPAKPITAHNHTEALHYVMDALTRGSAAVIRSRDEIGAIGHRVVHGGEKFTSAVIINDDVVQCIKECCPLAPLHNPANLAGILACQEALPGVPNVAAFDTAFHQTMPPHAFHYALPFDLYKNDHVRRYGFHGTSHKYVMDTFSELTKIPIETLCIITCHLGNGSSLTAVKDGRSVDTTMGFTPLQGVVMGTRSGDIDPAVVFYLMREKGLTADQVDTMLNKKSGLLGFSGVSSDMRDILAAVSNGNARAALALKLCVYSIAKYIGAYAAILPRLDGIVFTAGIGENCAEVRSSVCEHLPGLHIVLDHDKNSVRGARRISTSASAIPVWVIPTNEELEIAKETYELMEVKHAT